MILFLEMMIWHGNANESMGLLFKDKAYKKLWMSNQVPSNVFEIKHPYWILASHDLKVFSRWLVQLRFYNDIKNKIRPIKWLNQPLKKNSACLNWS